MVYMFQVLEKKETSVGQNSLLLYTDDSCNLEVANLLGKDKVEYTFNVPPSKYTYPHRFAITCIYHTGY